MRRYPTKQMHDPGSNMELCSAPLPPPRPGQRGRQRCGLGGLRPDVVLRRRVPRGFNAALVVGVVVAVGGERGGGARRLAGFLAGVRRTKIEAGRYKAGWMRLSAGGRKRWAAALVAGTRTGSQGRGASLGVAGDGDGRGPDNRAADAPPSRFGWGGLSSRPPSIVTDPWTAMARTVGIRSGRVIGVISR